MLNEAKGRAVSANSHVTVDLLHATLNEGVANKHKIIIALMFFN